jgi:signal recognition particle receptor subunit beta
MVFANSEDDQTGRYLPATVEQSVKIVVMGAFGVGKTTLIGAVSEITPLRTEETMTAASVGIDSLAGVGSKTTTTVAMDFGRITLDGEVVLYVFGAPGQQRFWGMWDGLADGALGALVLIDLRRLDDSFAVLDQLEMHAMPFAVAINRFPDSPRHVSEQQVRDALDLLPGTPLLECDARDHGSSVAALIALVEHALTPDSAEALT